MRLGVPVAVGAVAVGAYSFTQLSSDQQAELLAQLPPLPTIDFGSEQLTWLSAQINRYFGLAAEAANSLAGNFANKNVEPPPEPAPQPKSSWTPFLIPLLVGTAAVYVYGTSAEGKANISKAVTSSKSALKQASRTVIDFFDEIKKQQHHMSVSQTKADKPVPKVAEAPKKAPAHDEKKAQPVSGKVDVTAQAIA